MGDVKIIVDTGVDKTKCNVIYDGIDKSFYINNVFSAVHNMSPDLLEIYNDDESMIFNINTVFMDHSIIGNFANGKIYDNEFNTSTEVLHYNNTVRVPKYNQDITVLLLHAILFRAINILKNRLGVEYSGVNLSFDIIFLEYKSDIAKVKLILTEILSKITKLNMVLPSNVIPVNIDKISFIPRGYCAYAACVFNKNREYIHENKYLLNHKVLICDIGSLQTDFTIIENNNMYNFELTINSGLKKMFDNVITNMMLNGIIIKSDVINKYIETGKSENADEIHRNIVSEFDNYISKCLLELTQTLKAENIDLNIITDMIICGKGAILDIEDYFLKALKTTYNKDIKLVTYNDSCEDLNIIGANILSYYLV